MSQRPQTWKSPEDMTDRQWRFVAEYALSGNAADAARKAGYAPGSARQTGSRLLTYKYIRQAIKLYTVEQITQCKRPLRRALRNLDRQGMPEEDLKHIHRLLNRLVELAEHEGKTTEIAGNEEDACSFKYKSFPPFQQNISSVSPAPAATATISCTPSSPPMERVPKASVIARKLRRY